MKLAHISLVAVSLTLASVVSAQTQGKPAKPVATKPAVAMAKMDTTHKKADTTHKKADTTKTATTAKMGAMKAPEVAKKPAPKKPH